jgi:hypothetical protein
VKSDLKSSQLLAWAEKKDDSCRTGIVLFNDSDREIPRYFSGYFPPVDRGKGPKGGRQYGTILGLTADDSDQAH